MLGLYLIAAHMLGDFVFQNRWMAAFKLRSSRVRAQHVFFYTLPFVAVVYYVNPEAWKAAAFLVLLFVLHFLADSHRFRSTLGDVVQWRLDLHRDPIAVKKAWLEYVVESPNSLQAADVSDEVVRWPTPNPWPAAPLMIDQTIHLVTLAVLGGLFLT